MSSKSSCQHRNLVVGENCRVEQCSRGTVHVVFGDLTLRFRPTEFLQVSTALRVAADRLEGPPTEMVATRLLC